MSGKFIRNWHLRLLPTAPMETVCNKPQMYLETHHVGIVALNVYHLIDEISRFEMKQAKRQK